MEEDFMEQRAEPPSLVQTDVRENFSAQQVDWQNVNVKSMGGDGVDEPMAEKIMCDILGIASEPSDDDVEEDNEGPPVSDIEEDKDSEIEVVEQETGDDVIDESLMKEAAILIDDEVTSELEITYDPVVPVIMVSTYFANMVEFRKAFAQYYIIGEFDVFRTRNTRKRCEARCRLDYYNGGRVKDQCPWKISVRILSDGETVRVLTSFPRTQISISN
jgi:hypothetical protein